ncbi:hypothetical protein [Plesiomonas shigelloides]|nr:hypothetical protein [Plesiomonas shigelloides]
MTAAPAMGMSMCVFMIVLVRMVMVSSMLAARVLMRRGDGLSGRGFSD